ncbi:bifunctional aminoglycoside phosphotransferase/ATP-binding protein [Nocardia jiangsuensis]|uniref:AAA family ATPase n=1 Tax=Nocardia jiangsuensis TaxID=1691563 RepID=A0ABV8DND3_9NOCA
MPDLTALRSAPAEAPAGEPFSAVHETHTGVVVLCGARAYKAKKPVVTDFLDFGTAERRRAACLRELELNRRLAPDVYLGTATLTDPDGGPDETLVVMRRMPERLRLSAVLDDPARPPSPLPALAGMLARFHATARRRAEIDRAGTPERLRARWRALLDPLAARSDAVLDPAAVARLDAAAMRFLDGRAPLFTERIAAGRVVDGHGDLLAQDIFVLPDGIRILDCLDFDDRLRFVDALDDVAFLAMDLEFRGHPGLAAAFLDDYAHAAGDPAPPSLRHHYIAYRATVRAKTDLIRHDQGDDTAAARARRHLGLALDHLDRATVRLILVGGLPGTGKSTLAASLARETGAAVFSSDHTRARLRAAGAITGAAGSYGAGAYSPAAKEAVYTALLAAARERLERGEPVILDAAWTDRNQRERAAALAAATHSDLVTLRCTCPRELADQRIRARTGGFSEATPAIAAALAADETPWPDAVPVDTAGPIQASLTLARRAFAGAP